MCDPEGCLAGGVTAGLAAETATFTAAPDVPYTFVVDGYAQVRGGFSITIDCTECVPEGGYEVVVPGAPSCCPGLDELGCMNPDTDGVCHTCGGASPCTHCGDSDCNPPENKCNCPADCQ